MKNINFLNIKKLLKTRRNGKMFILVDDESRENEGDLNYYQQKLLRNQLILWPSMVEV